VHRVLSLEDIARITGTYPAWRGDKGELSGLPLFKEDLVYVDIPGFCKSASLDTVREQGYVLTPGRYVGVEELEGDGELFETKFGRLVQTLESQFAESAKLEKKIRVNLKCLNH
jgi:type I restriction enzyme M protein